MAETQLHTFQDMVDRLLDTFGELARDQRHLRLARRAVLNAYRDLPNYAQWSYYMRRGHLTTVVSQSTGSIEYDHSGHASGERVVLLTGATFPTDAWLYNILIDNVRYKIEDFIDSTTIQLPSDTNPGSDLSSGTGYTLFKSVYPAPINLRKSSALIDLARGYYLLPMSPDEALQHQAGNQQPEESIGYTIRNPDEYYGAMSFELASPPNQARTYDYIYEASPRAIKTDKENSGTVSVSAGSTTVNGSSTAFADKHIGSIIRFSDSATAPTPPEGNLDGDNPYAVQRVITAVTSTTQLTIDEQASASTTYSDVAYVISDPIDLEAHAMFSLMERLAEAEFARLSDRKDMSQWEGRVHRELIKARIADNRLRDYMEQSMGADKRFYTLRDWAVDESIGGSVIT